MSINTLAATTKFTENLDLLFEQKAVTNIFLDNAFGAQFVGSKIVSIPSFEFVGLADYDRDEGFNRSAMNVTRQTYTLTKDRARSITVDRMDMDEAGVAGLAGKIMGEFVRTKVVPECDAYILSKIYGVASSKSHKTLFDASKSALTQFLAQANAINANNGYGEELVAFVDSTMWAAIMADALTKGMISIDSFKAGNINVEVKKINDVIIIPVADARMKSAYTFADGKTTAGANDPAEGGFTAAEDAESIRMLILPKDGASVIKKTEKMRVFTPDQNQDADAYKFDYRIYYDAFVKNSQVGNIYALYTA